MVHYDDGDTEERSEIEIRKTQIKSTNSTVAITNTNHVSFSRNRSEFPVQVESL